MRLNVKLLNGTTFPVEFDPEITVVDLKHEIEVSHPDLTASGQVLIHNGNILKDNVIISKCGITEDSFIVCMIKKKNTSSASTAPTSAPTGTNSSSSSFTTPVQPRTTISTPPAPSNTSTAPAPRSPGLLPTVTPAPSTASASTNPFVTPARNPQPTTADSTVIIQQLSSMGFPESEVRVALQAARGNPDVAIEFLFNGIPDSFYQQQQPIGTFHPTETAPTTTTAAPNTRTQASPLDMLRRHPQINTLRAMFQQSPSSIPILLNQIGQSSPELLEAIHQNRDEFIQILNEPPTTPTPTTTGFPSTLHTPPSQQVPHSHSIPPEQLQQIAATQALFAQQIQTIPPEQQRSLAALFNLTPEQLPTFITAMPPEDFLQFLNMSMGGTPGMGGMGGGAMGGDMPGGPAPHVLRFTQKELEDIHRLMELGFDQSEVIQAYMACDKNENLAANLLYDGMSENLLYGGGASFGQYPTQPLQPTSTITQPTPSSTSSTTTNTTIQPTSSTTNTDTTTTTTTTPSTQQDTKENPTDENNNNQNQQPPKDDEDDMYS